MSGGMNKHGGTRSGAGRPLKWNFYDVLTIGQACESKWREASNEALKARRAALAHADLIQSLQNGVQTIPVPQRKAWLESEAYAEHRADLEAWLHARAGTPFDDETANYAGDAPRRVTVSTKPPRGTRQRIICQVAKENELTESAVDNLWQLYRRFEKELRESAET